MSKELCLFCELFGNWWVFVTYQAVSKTSATICSLAIKYFKYPANFSSYILFQSIMLKIHFILFTNRGTESFSASFNWIILMWKLFKGIETTRDKYNSSERFYRNLKKYENIFLCESLLVPRNCFLIITNLMFQIVQITRIDRLNTIFTWS